MALPSKEKSTLLRVPELLQHGDGELLRQSEVSLIASRLKGIEERCGQEGIIVQIAVELRLTVLVHAE